MLRGDPLKLDKEMIRYGLCSMSNHRLPTGGFYYGQIIL